MFYLSQDIICNQSIFEHVQVEISTMNKLKLCFLVCTAIHLLHGFDKGFSNIFAEKHVFIDCSTTINIMHAGITPIPINKLQSHKAIAMTIMMPLHE